jgi:flagellar hook-associated protein 1 FlgK
VKSLNATSSAIMLQIDQQIQSVSGVSLDDEMANMLRYQRSYQAAAKALSIFDQTTETLINLVK